MRMWEWREGIRTEPLGCSDECCWCFYIIMMPSCYQHDRCIRTVLEMHVWVCAHVVGSQYIGLVSSRNHLSVLWWPQGKDLYQFLLVRSRRCCPLAIGSAEGKCATWQGCRDGAVCADARTVANWRVSASASASLRMTSIHWRWLHWERRIGIVLDTSAISISSSKRWWMKRAMLFLSDEKTSWSGQPEPTQWHLC